MHHRKEIKVGLDQTVDLEVEQLEAMDIHQVLLEVLVPLANLLTMAFHRAGQIVSSFFDFHVL